jgi:hypothetical protein
MIDKHLVKATHDINVSEMSDDELQESIVQLNLEHCAKLVLDPEQTTVTEYLRAQIEEHESRLAWSKQDYTAGLRGLADRMVHCFLACARLGARSSSLFFPHRCLTRGPMAPHIGIGAGSGSAKPDHENTWCSPYCRDS